VLVAVYRPRTAVHRLPGGQKAGPVAQNNRSERAVAHRSTVSSSVIMFTCTYTIVNATKGDDPAGLTEKGA
jgi:hypothetical protein